MFGKHVEGKFKLPIRLQHPTVGLVGGSNPRSGHTSNGRKNGALHVEAGIQVHTQSLHTMGWIPDLNWARLWRLAKALINGDFHMPFGSAVLLYAIGGACESVHDEVCYAERVLSFSTLTRVNDVAFARQWGVNKSSFSFSGLTKCERRVTRQLGPYTAVCTRWLQRTKPASRVIFDGAEKLGLVYLDSCRAPPMQTCDGILGDGWEEQTCMPLLFYGASSTTGEDGPVSAWHTTALPPLTTTRYSQWHNCFGQQRVDLDGKTPT